MRSLSKEGREEIGHLFPAGEIPVEEITPRSAHLGDEGEHLIFLIPLSELTPEQQDGIFEYVVEKFGCTKEEARTEIESNGHFPIRQTFVIESYDRLFM